MKLQAVIFDWAGTLVDHGSFAPVAALQSVFSAAGVPVSDGEAREPMGVAKKDHIRAIVQMPRVREAWQAAHASPAGEAEIDALYDQFTGMQLDALKNHAQVIAGVPEAVQRMRGRGLKIGSCTGYNREMLDYLLRRSAEQGLLPDAAVCPEDAGAGRPAPFMCYLNAVLLRVFPLFTVVKIGDTPVDMHEARNAGMWAIGITRTGNEVGLSAADWDGAPAEQRQAALQRAGLRLHAAGAHFLAESAAECDELLEDISARVGRGERPE